jgi:hypothetical protein
MKHAFARTPSSYKLLIEKDGPVMADALESCADGTRT